MLFIVEQGATDKSWKWAVVACFRLIRKIAKKRLLGSSRLSLRLCLSLRMEQLGSHWKDFYEILYLRLLEDLSRKLKFD
jgi:hypothetical protein